MDSMQFFEDIAHNVSWINDIYINRDLDDIQQRPYCFMYEILLAFIDIANDTFIAKENVDENLAKLEIFLDIVEDYLQKKSSEVISLISVGFLENLTPDMEIFPFVSEVMKHYTNEVLEYNHNPGASIPAVFSNDNK
jgi:hypothetical protein